LLIIVSRTLGVKESLGRVNLEKIIKDCEMDIKKVPEMETIFAEEIKFVEGRQR
jgi:hypothetical protein